MTATLFWVVNNDRLYMLLSVIVSSLSSVWEQPPVKNTLSFSIYRVQPRCYPTKVPEGIHLPTNAIWDLTVNEMNSITPLCERRERRNHSVAEEYDKMEGRRGEMGWNEGNYREMTERRKISSEAPPTPSPPVIHLLIYIPHLMLSLISFRWILITAITAHRSSHVLWKHSTSVPYHPTAFHDLRFLFFHFQLALWAGLFIQGIQSLYSWCSTGSDLSSTYPWDRNAVMPLCSFFRITY